MGTIPVKINGTWRLIRFENTDEELCQTTIKMMKELGDWLPESKKDPKGRNDKIRELKKLVDGSSLSSFESQIYINGTRISPQTEPENAPKGELLRIDTDEQTITWSENNKKGWPYGDTIQIWFYSESPEEKDESYKIFRSSFSYRKPSGKATMLFSKLSDEKRANYLAGPVKQGEFDGDIENVRWFKDGDRRSGKEVYEKGIRKIIDTGPRGEAIVMYDQDDPTLFVYQERPSIQITAALFNTQAFFSFENYSVFPD